MHERRVSLVPGSIFGCKENKNGIQDMAKLLMAMRITGLEVMNHKSRDTEKAQKQKMATIMQQYEPTPDLCPPRIKKSKN